MSLNKLFFKFLQGLGWNFYLVKISRKNGPFFSSLLCRLEFPTSLDFPENSWQKIYIFFYFSPFSGLDAVASAALPDVLGHDPARPQAPADHDV